MRVHKCLKVDGRYDGLRDSLKESGPAEMMTSFSLKR